MSRSECAGRSERPQREMPLAHAVLSLHIGASALFATVWPVGQGR